MTRRLQIGNWLINQTPPEWEVLSGHGLRRTGVNSFPSTIVFSEEKLPAGMSLPEYVKNQIEAMKVLFHNPKIEGPTPAAMPEANEAQKLGVSYNSFDGHEVIHVQIYAIFADMVGIVTLTTIPDDASKITGNFQGILSDLRFGIPSSHKDEGT